MRPAIRRAIVRLKQLYDAKEQGFFGALSTALNVRRSSERLLVGLSGLVLIVGLALALSLRQRVRKDFARAYAALTAEVEERKAAERAVRASEERFRSLVQNSSDVISIVDADGGVRYHSESVRRVLGYDPADLVDGDPLSLVHPDDRERVARFVAEAALRPGVTAAETWRMRHRDGTWLHSETVAANLLEDPNVRGLVLNTRDVSDRKELEAQLVHQAFHDGLTGLANRTLFTERVEHALARAGQGDLAVLFIDLDDFKHVNDSLGHAAGDQLLIAAARRLQGCLRPTDTAARLGGDEFAVLLERVTDAESAAAVAGRVLDTLHQPFGLNGRTIPIKASLGVATGRPGADEADELLRNADVAMYAAKAGGKDRYELFHPDMHEDMLQRLELEAELRHVADRDQLVLHYQPIVELVSGRITRVEALVRWDHPTKGLLPPPAFIPLAEEQGLIGPIGDWVLLQACLQARRWQDQFPDAPPLSVHVNLSGRQLEEQRLVGEVVQALEMSRLSPRLLTLEITESVLVTDIEAMSARLRELKGLGVLLAIDDFGTGYSSLSYLRRFPIDMLKIDKAFVDGIGRGREDTALAHAIVKLSHTLQLHSVAEGIEQRRAGDPPGRPRLPGRPGLPVRPAAGRRGHDRAAGHVPGRRRVLPARGRHGRRGGRRDLTPVDRLHRMQWLQHYDQGVPETLSPYPERTLLDDLAEAVAERPDAPAAAVQGPHASPTASSTGSATRSRPPWPGSGWPRATGWRCCCPTAPSSSSASWAPGRRGPSWSR